DLEAAAVVHAGVQGTSHRSPAPRLGLGLDRRQQRLRDLLILGLEEAEEGHVLGMHAVVGVVVDERHASYDVGATAREEEAFVGVLPERVLLLVEQLELTDPQRRHPVIVVPVLLVREVDELAQLALRTHRFDAERRHAQPWITPSRLPTRAKAASSLSS